ncbi:hypothetical protein CN234_17455 [Sinorhizobium meliloti]|uniref:hypothetical protein n=1 Tax=Rhizobium meliloti TaxID=382 RepID=UPI000FD862BF|nr:hypothetical protein [Sinorhizobium meliloti]RVG08569.1 hypothetical protein CN234_17455 [Sinorhizobium meliloti]
MQRYTVTLEVEFSDLPEDARDDLADGVNFRAEDDELNSDLDTVPTVAEMDPSEIKEAIFDFFDGMDGDYEAQAEAWAGSSVFGWLSAISVKSVKTA